MNVLSKILVVVGKVIAVVFLCCTGQSWMAQQVIGLGDDED